MNKWKSSSCLEIGRINTVEIPTLYKAIYRFNATLIKILSFFHRNRTKIL